MVEESRDAAFAGFVARERAQLLGAARLMYGVPSRAEDVVQAVLAALYVNWSPTGAKQVALQQIMTAAPGPLALPWRRGDRFELVDSTAAGPALPAGIVADLAQLDDDSRRAVILRHYVELDDHEAAAVAGTDVAGVATRSRQAETQLAALDPTRRIPGQLSVQLRAAASQPGVETDTRVDLGPDIDDDLAHGRLLVRRRRARAALLAAAVCVLALLGVTQLVPALRADPVAAGPVPGSGPGGTVTATPARPTPTCDAAQASCRADTIRDWRAQMAQVVSSYLDPDQRYYSGYTVSDDKRYDSGGFWVNGAGLGFDLARVNVGATEIFVQIATSPQYAMPCGRLTKNSCVATRFMDGNVFTLSDSTQLSRGLEVQYSPRGDEVITVVARNTSSGPQLELGRDQLMTLVQDARLRLPPR